MQFIVTVSGIGGDVHPDHVREALESQAAGLVDLVDASQVTVELAPTEGGGAPGHDGGPTVDPSLSLASPEVAAFVVKHAQRAVTQEVGPDADTDADADVSVVLTAAQVAQLVGGESVLVQTDSQLAHPDAMGVVSVRIVKGRGHDAMPGLAPLTVPGELVEVLAEALGDALAFRTDSGEGSEDDYDREIADRYEGLLTALGVTVSN